MRLLPIGDRVALASFPRTGNSMLRKFLEQITGVFTGSDMSLDLTIMMQVQGMLGEETVDNSCWISKTHAPLTQDKPTAFDADKIIYITRHPIDVFPSMMSLMFTQCHSIEPKLMWSQFKVWKTFTEHMLPRFAKYHTKLME